MTPTGRQKDSKALHGGRAAITRAALSSFFEVGYHGTSMRHIAQQAGTTIGSIYHHFESKQEILHEVMLSTLDDVLVETRMSLAAAGPDPVAGLAAVVHTWIAFHATRRREALVGNSEMRSLDARGRRLVVPRRDTQERLFREVIAAGVVAGAFRTSCQEEAARAILSMGHSVATWYVPRGPLTPSEIAARYTRFALAIVEAEPSAGRWAWQSQQ